MWDEYLVSRLSSKASQVLLSLLLTRQVEVERTSAEFAKTTGLGQRSIAPALLELKEAGLIQIIPQPGKPSLVRLVHPEEYRYETTIVETNPEVVGQGGRPILVSNVQDAGVREAGEGGGPVESAGLLEACHMADESKDKELRIASLQDVWDFAFPFDEYPNQRLSNLNAQQLLVNRSAEWVGQVILDSVEHATSRIQAPRAYIQKAVDMEERRHRVDKGISSERDVPVINDDLRRLVELGKEQFSAKSKDSPGDQS